jgi:hypothetical protein
MLQRAPQVAKPRRVPSVGVSRPEIEHLIALRLQLRHKGLPSVDPPRAAFQLTTEGKRTESAHARGGLVQMPIQALSDVIAFADVYPASR